MKLLKTMAFILPFTCFASQAISDLEKGWSFLTTNRWDSTFKYLELATHGKDIKEVKEAYALLSVIYPQQRQFEKASQASQKLMNLGGLSQQAYWDANLLNWSENSEMYKFLESKNLIEYSEKNPQEKVFLWDLLIKEKIRHGDFKSAEKLAIEIPRVRQWKWLGSFPNEGGRGFNKIYSPEKRIIFSDTIKLEDGRLSTWQNTIPQRLDGWIFVDNLSNQNDAINYFYTEVQSATDTLVALHFGLSGMFKLWVNDSLIFSDPIFRNLGSDSYNRNVVLKKGNNRILLKLGHRDSPGVNSQELSSNFTLRFSSLAGVPLSLKNEIQNSGPGDLNLLNPQIITQPLNVSIPFDSQKKSWALFLDYCKLQSLYLNEEASYYMDSLLVRYPQSSFLMMNASYIQNSRQNDIKSEQLAANALKLDSNNIAAWDDFLNRKLNKLDIASWKNILDRIPLSIQKVIPKVLISRIGISGQNGDGAEVLKLVSDLEKKFPNHYDAILTLFYFYNQIQKTNDAEKVLNKYLKNHHGYYALVEMGFNIKSHRGDLNEIQNFLKSESKFNPDDVRYGQLLASLYFVNQKNKEALKELEKVRKLVPNNENTLQSLAMVYNALNLTDSTKKVLKTMVNMTNNHFLAWDQLRKLEGQKNYWDLLPLPSLDSLRQLSKSWKVDDDNEGIFLTNQKDVLMYPTGQGRTRFYWVIDLPNEKAVDSWSKVSLGYNSSNQSLQIIQAKALSAQGEETSPDRDGNELVFKALKPGSTIVLEWVVSNYYKGILSKSLYGSLDWLTYMPTVNQTIRFVTPIDQEIPLTYIDKSFKLDSMISSDIKVKSWNAQYRKALPKSNFLPDGMESQTMFAYSTLKSWNEIAKWYLAISAVDHEDMKSIKQITDSLFLNLKTDDEKLKVLHDYITTNVRYSSISFRQSGWIPQNPIDVLESKLGDCKDMAHLAKVMLQFAGIESRLVLVDAPHRVNLKQVEISPSFNHCILSVKINNQWRYVDLTSADLDPKHLPVMDQGSMALVIDASTQELIRLPVDRPEDRLVVRSSVDSLSLDLIKKRNVKVMKTGVYASYMREDLRYKDSTERFTDFSKYVLSLPNGKLHHLDIYQGIDKNVDTLLYNYIESYRGATSPTQSLVITPIEIIDGIEMETMPICDSRTEDIDLIGNSVSSSLQKNTLEIVYPKEWKLTETPESVHKKTEFGNYDIDFSLGKNGVIKVNRSLSMNIHELIPKEKCKELNEFLDLIMKTDETQLVFSKKK